MATESRIEWTETTWNPVTGCSKISQGCKHCYAERLALRLQAMGLERYRNGFEVTLQEQALTEPLAWKRPRKVFVNSMSDLFHEAVPLDFIQRIFGVMQSVPRHTFQVLTKRSSRLRELATLLPWPSNVWMGVSVENEQVLSRVRDLSAVPAAVRFLSCEPLIGPLASLPLADIHWVIVGGESGPSARPMRLEWVEDILQQCRAADVAFFFKQWGGVRKAKFGRTLHDRTYDEYPTLARVPLSPPNSAQQPTPPCSGLGGYAPRATQFQVTYAGNRDRDARLNAEGMYVESVAIVMPSKEAAAFAASAISDQELIDRSTVLQSEAGTWEYQRVKITLE